MKYDVIVLGGGVIGITTAFYLWDRGLEVAVVERNDLPSEETSFGNGGYRDWETDRKSVV